MELDRITPGQEVVVKLPRRAQLAIARVEQKGVTMRGRRGRRLNNGVRVVTTEDALGIGGSIIPAGHRQTILSRDVREPASDDWRSNIRYRVEDRNYGQRVRTALREKGVRARLQGGEVTMSVQDAGKLAGLSE